MMLRKSKLAYFHTLLHREVVLARKEVDILAWQALDTILKRGRLVDALKLIPTNKKAPAMPGLLDLNISLRPAEPS